jgi:hypothetical protein
MSAESDEDALKLYRTTEGYIFYRGLTNAELRATPLPVASTTSTYKLRLDDVGGGVSYIGEADPGTSLASALWRIKRITDVGKDTSIDWADGNGNFDNVWNNRLALAYS